MPDYALYYWPVPFRGHFIRYVLAHVGASWEEPGYNAIVGLKSAPPDAQPYPFMAPPLLHDLGRDRWLSQMPAIMMHLGRKYDLPGDPDEALRLVCDASDVLLEITRHHGDMMWDRPSWTRFTGERLPRWMQLHESLVTRGDYDLHRPGLSELTLAALWHTMVERLPGLHPLLVARAPHVEALGNRIAALPRIASMRARWGGDAGTYCGGQIEASIRDMLDTDAKELRHR